MGIAKSGRTRTPIPLPIPQRSSCRQILARAKDRPSTKEAARISSNAFATYNYAMASNDVMASAAHSSEQARQAQDVRRVVDTIPTLAWSARADGSADFFNQRWLDYTGPPLNRRMIGAGLLYSGSSLL